VNNNRMRNYFLIFCIAVVNAGYAQQPVPAPVQNKPVLLSGGTLHIGNGRLIENGLIAFENGRITVVGNSDTLDKSRYEILDVAGKHIYPGFISPNTIMGLSEIEAARATNDYTEIGAMNPNVRAIIAYNTDSKVSPTVRTNGILMAQVVPQGGMITGQSSVVELDGWNWEDASYKTDEGIHVNWPGMIVLGYSWAEPQEAQRERMEKQFQSLKAFFREAKAYHESENIQEKNLRFEAMRGVFDGSKKVYIHADYVKEIISAVNFSRELGLKMVLVGGADSWMVTDLLKENNVPVIINKTHSLPAREMGDVDLSYKLPSLLEKAGVLYAISIEGFWQQRNLPFNAGTAAAYGLTREQALSAITLNTAKILGIDKTTGSLEPGKDATLIVSAGDALDMRTNNIEYAFIRGRRIQLSNIQGELYKKYKTRYGLN
jgi:imidazolonepropionase-like amidohydrolase